MNLKCFLELIAVVPQTYEEAIQKYPWLPGEPHEWDNRTTIENAIWLIRYLTFRHAGLLSIRMSDLKRSNRKDQAVLENTEYNVEYVDAETIKLNKKEYKK